MKVRWWAAAVLAITVSGAAPASVVDCPGVDPVGWYERNVDPATLTWDRFAAHAPDERAIILRYVGADLRTHLRRAHLLRSAADPRFNADQQAIIRRVRAFYAEDASVRTPSAVRELEEDVARSFNREEAWIAFKVLGPAVAPERTATDTGDSWWCECRSVADCVHDDDLTGRCSNPWCIWKRGCGPARQFWCLRKCV